MVLHYGAVILFCSCFEIVSWLRRYYRELRGTTSKIHVGLLLLFALCALNIVIEMVVVLEDCFRPIWACFQRTVFTTVQ